MRIRRLGPDRARLHRGLSVKRHHVSQDFYQTEEIDMPQVGGQNELELRECEGIKLLWWKNENGLWHGPCEAFPNLREICLAQVKKHDLILTAGGGFGMYPALWAKVFARVVTAEPDPDNFAMLKENCKGENFTLLDLALSNQEGDAQFYRSDTRNVGMHSLVEGRGNKDKAISVRTQKIDNLNLPALDLLQLDVEGWESKVLAGAVITIEKFWPVIALETVDEDAQKFLKERDYQWARSTARKADEDAVFVKGYSYRS
jgi:FkbM family methyltransferase